MQQQRHSEVIEHQAEKSETPPANHLAEREEKGEARADRDGENKSSAGQEVGLGFDWLALGLILLIAAFFALTARFNSQPAPSFVPAAVLSATGCGLLATGLRKLRTSEGVALFEAALGGFFLALFQFAAALTYPGVFTTLTSAPVYGRAFLVTWGLIGLCTVIASIAGAAVGHLAFAPPRSLPTRAPEQARSDETAEGEDGDRAVEENSENGETAQEHTPAGIAETAEETGAIQENSEGEEEYTDDVAAEPTEESEETEEESSRVEKRPRLLLNYAITVVLLGLLPMMIGYVFAAAYDFTMGAMSVDRISPGLYPTLSLLSGLLPWRLAVPINLTSSNGLFIVFTLLWRVPDSFLGNPRAFDIQTLEPLLFNAAGLAFLLVTMYGRARHESKPRSAPWGSFIFLEALLGLALVLPASLWIFRGLEGIIQALGTAVQLPTIYLLNSPLLILNLVTGPLCCMLVGLTARRQYQLWTLPRRKAPERSV